MGADVRGSPLLSAAQGSSLLEALATWVHNGQKMSLLLMFSLSGVT